MALKEIKSKLDAPDTNGGGFDHTTLSGGLHLVKIGKFD